jgi:hypothetical protein
MMSSDILFNLNVICTDKPVCLFEIQNILARSSFVCSPVNKLGLSNKYCGLGDARTQLECVLNFQSFKPNPNFVPPKKPKYICTEKPEPKPTANAKKVIYKRSAAQKAQHKQAQLEAAERNKTRKS